MQYLQHLLITDVAAEVLAKAAMASMYEKRMVNDTYMDQVCPGPSPWGWWGYWNLFACCTFSWVRYRLFHAIDFGDIAAAGVSIDLICSSKAPGIFSGSLA